MRLLYSLLICVSFCTCVHAQFHFGPVAVCKSTVNVALPPDGCQADITPGMIDGGSFHGTSGYFWSSVSPGTLAPGTRTVTLTVSDWYGYSRCTSTVVVEDKTPPVAVCDYGLQTFANSPNVTDGYHPSNIDYGTTDNCDFSLELFNTQLSPRYWGPQWLRLVATDDAGNSSQCYTDINVLSPNMPSGWSPCFPRGDNYFEDIHRVQLSGPATSINNIVAPGGTWYSDYYTVTPGVNLSLILTPEYFHGTYPEYWVVLYDQNVDGDFEDAGEVVYSGRGTGVQAATIVLADLPGRLAISKLRILMSYDPITDYCPTDFYGSHVDFTVRMADHPNPLADREEVASAASRITPEASGDVRPEPKPAAAVRAELARREEKVVASGVAVYPNPARRGGTVRLTGVEGTIELFSVTGRRMSVQGGDAGATSAEISLPADLVPGVYLLKVGDWTERLVVR